MIVASCTTSKGVYWCGDHECINKKEKEAYFKKTMIVEVRNLEGKKRIKNSESEKILQQAKLNEKERIKLEKDAKTNSKKEKKRKIKEEKLLAKQKKLEQKMKIKEEKELQKQIKLEEKRRAKEQKKLSKIAKIENNKKIKKTNKKVELGTKIGNIKIEANKFSELVEKITKRNIFRPYPDINDIPK